MKVLLLAALSTMSLVASAADSPDDFAFAMPIEGLGGDALHRVSIPQSVYEAAAYSDLRDLRVFNGSGEVVPYALRPLDRVVQAPAPVALPLFALRGPRDARADDLDLSFEKSAGKVSVRLKSRGAKAPGQALLGYLIDASAVKTPLNGLGVEWGPSRPDSMTAARLEAGDDLRHWTTLAVDAPLGGLSHANQRLERKVVEFRSRQAKYLRLMWIDPARAIELKGVNGLLPEQTAQPERAWKEIIATPDARKPGDYFLDVGGRFPLDRLAPRLPEQNTVAPLQIFSKARPEDPWTIVTRTVAYRLKRNGQELVSPDIAVGTNTHRYWLLRVDTASGGIGAGTLAVRAGWTPREIVFTARGAAPFRLAYGNSKAQAGALAIDALVPGWRTDQEPKISVAVTGAAQTLAGEAAARQRIDYKKWGLWAALVAAVAMLAWMAWMLSKQMQRNEKT